MSGLSLLNALKLQGYDLSDHSSFSRTLVNTSLVFGLLVLASSFLRYASVIFLMGRNWDASDSNMLFAVITSNIFCANNIYGSNRGAGKHIWDVGSLTDPSQFSQNAGSITVTLYVSYVLYILSSTGTKLSILCSYRSFFPRTTCPRFCKLNLGLMIVVVSTALSSVITLVFECHPIQSSWDWQVTREHCIDIQAFFNATSVINLAVDVIMVIAPLPLFLQINNTRSKRYTICALYSAGFVVCIASALRLAYLQGLQSIDAFYISGRGLIWSTVEVCLAITCGNIPSLKPLCEYWWGAWKCFASTQTAKITSSWAIARVWLDGFGHAIRMKFSVKVNWVSRIFRRLRLGRSSSATSKDEVTMVWEGGFDLDAFEFSSFSRQETSSVGTQPVEIMDNKRVDAASIV